MENYLHKKEIPCGDFKLAENHFCYQELKIYFLFSTYKVQCNSTNIQYPNYYWTGQRFRNCLQTIQRAVLLGIYRVCNRIYLAYILIMNSLFSHWFMAVWRAFYNHNEAYHALKHPCTSTGQYVVEVFLVRRILNIHFLVTNQYGIL